MTKSILIIDDHKIFAESLADYLRNESASYQVRMASTKVEANELIQTFTFNIALLDINLGGEDGLSLLPTLLQKDIKVAALTSYSDLRIAKKCIQMGAKGYILKESSTDSLITAMNIMESGKTYIDDQIKVKLLDQGLGLSQDKAYHERKNKAMLTEREKQVLKRISMEMTSEEIAKELFIAKSTVDTYRKNLINKLNVKNAVGLGVWAVKNGML